MPQPRQRRPTFLHSTGHLSGRNLTGVIHALGRCFEFLESEHAWSSIRQPEGSSCSTPRFDQLSLMIRHVKEFSLRQTTPLRLSLVDDILTCLFRMLVIVKGAALLLVYLHCFSHPMSQYQ